MNDPISRSEHREDIKAIWQRIDRREEIAQEARDQMNKKLDILLQIQASYQDLKNEVEGTDGEGGLKKKLNSCKGRTGARLARWPLLSLFLGLLNKW